MSAVPGTFNAPATTAEHALAYIQMGWGLCSVPRGTKGPRDSDWNTPALVIDTADKAVTACQARPSNGLGLVHSASGTCAIDVDHLEYFRVCMGELGLDLETLFAGAPRIVGKESRDKAIFRMPEGVPQKMQKLIWPAKSTDGKPTTVFELRAGPVQDVLPPTIHPDTQNPYRWRDGITPWELDAIPELPSALAHIWRSWDSFKPQFMALCPWAEAPPAPKPRARKDGPNSNVIGKFNDAHDLTGVLKGHGYKQVGRRFLAPTSESRLPGVIIFEDGTHCYSHHASDPLNDGHAHDPFSVFCMLEHEGDMTAAVRSAAELMGLDNERPEPVDMSGLMAKIHQPSKPAPFAGADIPAHLLTLPGKLGDVVDFYNRTAHRPQPQFAVQAALALGSVVAGRRYCTTMRNWTAMYYVNIAKSAAGKEHARTVIDTILEEAGLGKLAGPRGYTSDSGVFSSLYHQPNHIAIIDELGEMLRSANAQGNFHKRTANTALMEVWGLTSGTYRAPGYSTMALQAGQDASFKVVHRPSLTMLGMTTPRTFYDNLSESAIEGGFLNRLLIVESKIGRQPSRPTDPLDVPQSVLDWIAAVRGGNGGNLSGIDTAADQVPVPTIVEMDDAAVALARAYEREVLKVMDELEQERLDELEGRSYEKALRIAEVLAISVDSKRPRITIELMRWGIDYIRYYTAQTVEAVRRYMHGSQFGQWRTAVLEVITKGGVRGRTERELSKFSRVYAGLEPRMRKAVLDSLKGEGAIEYAKTRAASGRGRERCAWVALADDEADE